MPAALINIITLDPGRNAMYLNRILLLVLVMFYVFAPILTDWVVEGGTRWYRPHVIWLFVIAISGLLMYREPGDGA